jgi:hypothetical protein
MRLKGSLLNQQAHNELNSVIHYFTSAGEHFKTPTPAPGEIDSAKTPGSGASSNKMECPSACSGKKVQARLDRHTDDLRIL